MLLPGGLLLDERGRILESMSGQSWSRFALEDLRTVRLTADTGIVTYSVIAARGSDEYSALMSSLYVRRRDQWRLAFHQQTPR